jgi:hypothetical protein
MGGQGTVMGLCWAIVFASLAFGQVAFEDLSVNKGSEKIEASIKKADLIFVGKVSSIGPPPRLRSGGFMATQATQYEVEEVLKGTMSTRRHEIEIQHIVISGSSTGDPSPEANRLSSRIFASGNRLIIFATKKPSMWLGFDENYQVIPTNDSNIATIKRLVNQASGSRLKSQ